MLPAIAIIGGADSGKSTLIGTLLIETKSVPKNLIQKVKDFCKKENLVFEPAYLVDYIREELKLHSTRERALAELKIGKEKILIIDTPGQMILSKKMISGLSEAKTAIILIDATDNDFRKYRYYLKLASLLGISEIIAAINKMDLLGYKKERYENFLRKIGIRKKDKNFHIMPISALYNENLIKKSKLMPWHRGENLLKILRKISNKDKKEAGERFLMPVQSVLSIGKEKIALGNILEGTLSVGNEIKIFDGENNKGAKIEKLYHNDKKSLKVLAGENAAVVISPIGLISPIGPIRGDVFNDFGKRKGYFSNKIKAGIYILEPFSPKNLNSYVFKFLKGIYKIEKLKIEKHFNFQLVSLDNSDKLSANDFCDASIVLDKKIIQSNNNMARRFVIEDRRGGIVAIGVIKVL